MPRPIRQCHQSEKRRSKQRLETFGRDVQAVTITNKLQLQSFTLQQIVLRGIMQCCRLVGTDEFSAWIGTVGD